MPVPVPDVAQVRAALRAIVTDHGTDALSNAQLMAGLTSDLLPDAPREAQILRAAAELQLVNAIRDHVAGGMDIGTATGLAASSFASRTMYSPEICRWVTDEIAAVLDTTAEPPGEAATSLPVPRVGMASAPSGPAQGTGPIRTEVLPSPPLVSDVVKGLRRRTRVSLIVAGSVLTAAAALTITANLGHGSKPGSPDRRPGHARHIPAPPRTQVVIYEPWSTSGLAPGIRPHATLPGHCFSVSATSDRDDAFRCISGNSLFDPCFSDPYPGAEPSQLACPYPGLDSVTIIQITASLPSPPAGWGGAPNPWLVRLTTGQQCYSTAGSASFQVGGLTNTFVCRSGISLFGQPHHNAIWTIYQRGTGQANLTPTTIAKAYE